MDFSFSGCQQGVTLSFSFRQVIQRMELEKSDAVESIEEKLTNQITILTREMRELKELLNHTMNERTLAIEHAHKLTVSQTELMSRRKISICRRELCI